MPAIDQQYLDCSIYLYDSKDAADTGENFGGSGFLVSVWPNRIWDKTSFKNGRYTRYTQPPPHIYAVTNKHVVEQGYPVIRLNTIDDKIDVLELEEDDWIPHPDGDDLMVAPIELPEYKHSYHPITTEIFVRRFSPTTLVGAGDDVFMVGRFISHAGKQRNTPSLRFGSIAMLPFEKVRLQSGYEQEAFLVETRSISGYSGSPVFVYKPIQQTATIPPSPNDPYAGETHITSISDPVGYPLLLGIDCGHVRDRQPILNAEGKAHQYGWHVEINTRMAIVIPAWRLYDLLNKPEFVMAREEKDKKYREEKEAEKQSSSVAYDVAKPDVFTAESYEEALKRASRKISSQPESESDET